VVSPLYVDKETMKPEILVGFERKGKFSALFRIQQCGGVHGVDERLGLDDLLPAVADPIDNPQ
jgi:hypothetical protein